MLNASSSHQVNIHRMRPCSIVTLRGNGESGAGVGGPSVGAPGKVSAQTNVADAGDSVANKERFPRDSGIRIFRVKELIDSLSEVLD